MDWWFPVYYSQLEQPGWKQVLVFVFSQERHSCSVLQTSNIKTEEIL